MKRKTTASESEIKREFSSYFVGSILLSLGFLALFAFSKVKTIDMRGPIAMYALFISGERGFHFFYGEESKAMKYLNLLMSIGALILAIAYFVEIIRG